MPTTLEQIGLSQLPLEQKIDIMEQLREQIEAEIERTPLTENQKREIDRRLAAHRANPDAAIAWEEVEAAALARLSQ